jgi:hypothetical protein
LIGQLQNGPLLNGIRQMMLHNTRGHEMQWTKSHPERSTPQIDWTADDQGIYMADLVAGELANLQKEIQITTFTADVEALLSALVPVGQWVWTAQCLRHTMQRYHYHQYIVNQTAT